MTRRATRQTWGYGLRGCRLGRHLAAWLTLVGLALQIGLASAHLATHRDDPVGNPDQAGVSLAAIEPSRNPAPPTPADPPSHDPDACAICFALTAPSGFIPADPRLILPPSFEIATVNAANLPLAPSSRRHVIAAARAPPGVEIPA